MQTDSAATLLADHEAIFDKLEVLTHPAAQGDAMEIGRLTERAAHLMNEISYTLPHTGAEAAAALEAARYFASQAQDADDDRQRDTHHRALERCLAAVAAFLRGPPAGL